MPKHPTGPRTARALGLLAGIAVLPLASLPARADFDSCLAGIQSQAAAAGVSAQTFRAEDLEAVIYTASRAAVRGARVVLSHTDTPWIREQLVGWTITTVSTPSRLSPNAKTRGTREEIIAVIGGEA